jgi:hypothetical protein
VSDNYSHHNFKRKKLCRLRSQVVGKLPLASAYGVARRLYGSLWRPAKPQAAGITARLATNWTQLANISAQTISTGGSNFRGSHKVVSCEKDSQSPPVKVAGLAPAVKLN